MTNPCHKWKPIRNQLLRVKNQITYGGKTCDGMQISSTSTMSYILSDEEMIWLDIPCAHLHYYQSRGLKGTPWITNDLNIILVAFLKDNSHRFKGQNFNGYILWWVQNNIEDHFERSDLQEIYNPVMLLFAPWMCSLWFKFLSTTD